MTRNKKVKKQKEQKVLEINVKDSVKSKDLGPGQKKT